MKNRRHLLSMAFLLAALGLFVAFHFLPGFRGQELGWHVWPNLWRSIRILKHMQPQEAVVMACFLNFSLLIVVSPVLKDVFRKSLWAWWGAVIFSGIAGSAFWVMYVVAGTPHPEAGGWCLLLAPAFNFIGLLFVRGKASDGIGEIPEMAGPQ